MDTLSPAAEEFLVAVVREWNDMSESALLRARKAARLFDAHQGARGGSNHELVTACAVARAILTSLRSYYVFDHKLGGNESKDGVVQNIDSAIGRIDAAVGC